MLMERYGGTVSYHIRLPAGREICRNYSAPSTHSLIIVHVRPLPPREPLKYHLGVFVDPQV